MKCPLLGEEGYTFVFRKKESKVETTDYPSAGAELALKIQEVILRATEGRLKWFQAAETLLEISATVNSPKLAESDL